MSESRPKQLPPYGLRIPPELKARIQACAEANSRSLHSEIIHTLEEAYPAPRELGYVIADYFARISKARPADREKLVDELNEILQDEDPSMSVSPSGDRIELRVPVAPPKASGKD